MSVLHIIERWRGYNIYRIEGYTRYLVGKEGQIVEPQLYEYQHDAYCAIVSLTYGDLPTMHYPLISK